MTTSSATAPSSSNSPSRPFFRWEIAAENVVVDFHLNLIELLEREAVSVYPATTAGILLGRIDRSRNLIITAEHFESLTRERQSAESPFADEPFVQTQLNRWQRGNRIAVLGAYRTNSSGDAMLEAADLSVLKIIAQTGMAKTSQSDRTRTLAPLREQDLEPTTIFLLIESSDQGTHTAFAYLVRGNEIPLQSPAIPLNRLELSGRSSTKRTEIPASREIAPSRAPSRAPRIVPEMPEIDEATESPVKKERIPLQLQLNRKWLVGAAVVLLLATMWSLYRHRASFLGGRPSESVKAKADYQLNLKLEPAGTNWKLTWNTDSAAILDATKGQLFITDGGVTKVVDLNPSDLRGDSIMYTPLTNDLVFRLEVTTNGQAEPSSEAVRVVGGLPVSVAPPLDIQPDAVPPVGTPIDAGLQNEPGQVSTANGSSPAARPASQASNAFVPGLPVKNAPITSLKPKLSENISVTPKVPAPPVGKAYRTHSPNEGATLSRSAGSAVASNPARAISPSDPVKKPIESIPVIASPASRPSFPVVRRGAAVQPAQLLTNVNPSYPSAAKDTGVSGSVELHFKIGIAGDVHDVTVVRGPMVLAEAAVQAVRERRYKPARIDGVPTETDASAIFDFKLN